MKSRRHFIQQSTFAGLGLVVPARFFFLGKDKDVFSYRSDYLKVSLRRDYPAFSSLSTDSLGKKQFSINPLLKTQDQASGKYRSVVTRNSISWLLDRVPVWRCKMEHKSIIFNTRWEADIMADPFTMVFSQRANHCTVLGKMAGDRELEFPCVLHFPGMGSFRVYCSDPEISLSYDAELTASPYIKLSLPVADSKHRDITYKFESVAIYPEINEIRGDDRYDGFRKNYINIFQLSPRRRILANNSTSDACAFTLFLYAEMARKTPMLVGELTAMDLVRDTLDGYLGGVLGYGMVGKPNWQSEYNSSDSFPSMIMAACYYILDSNDMDWAKANYDGVAQWAKKMIATDTDKDGIIEYGYSGNSGSWDKGKFRRPANWWDTIGFGHDDAYSNALAYRASILLAEVAGRLDRSDDSLYFNAFARKLRSNYFQRFYNPGSGVLGGWRSADGELHDYYFTFVNSIAICYDLIDKAEGKKIMRTMLNKMTEVGYTDFRLGLPGNLIPIADEDYAHHDSRWGYQHFQVYENGGATGCYVYYTIRALFKLGMRKEAEGILFPMLESYKEANFSGSCPGSKMTKDWKTWKGACWGYEGFLVDNYLTLLNVSEYFES